MVQDPQPAQPSRHRPPPLSNSSSTFHGASTPSKQPKPTLLSVEPANDGEILQLSDSDDSSPPSPLASASPSLESMGPDDISKDLAALHELRKSVKKNLRLRPIRSRGNIPKVQIDTDLAAHAHFPPSVSQFGAASPTSTTSSYFTPIAEPPFPSSFSTSSTATFPPVPSPPLPSMSQAPCPISPKSLYNRLTSPRRPLLIDTRSLAAYQSFHIQHSINIAIPSLILKRCRRPGGGLQSFDTLRQFITTEQGKQDWDKLMSPGGPWDGDVVIYDDDMDLKDKDNFTIVAWAIIPIIVPLLSYGSVDYLEGGISKAGHHTDLETLIVTGDDTDPNSPSVSNTIVQPSGNPILAARKASLGLFQLDTQAALRSKQLPEIEPSSTVSTKPPSPPPRSPLPVMPSTSSSRNLRIDPTLLSLDASAPSPAPSAVGFRRPAPPRRPSVPNLRKLNTKSNERLNLSVNTNLPKFSSRTRPLRSATLAVPPSLTIITPQSPSHLQLVHSHHASSPPATAARFTSPISPTNDPANYLTPYYTPPHTPGTPRPPSPPSPMTARPDLDPPTTEEAYSVFTISTILPNFLYLGPELTSPEHVEELQELGVKRILNIAVECDDDQGLRLKEVFDKYYKIPMRDTVEEDNISKGVREVCDILDDARLHSAPTYVHCKAGKSRSVTAVIAYLIHANHWTLSRAYAFVLERRKGISPNIGFVSELMNFEEQELGGKSVGVQPTSMGSSNGHQSGLNGDGHSGSGYGYGGYDSGMGGGGPGGGGGGSGIPELMSSSRRGHVRESLPPALGMEGLINGAGPLSAGGVMDRVSVGGDSGQEMEIKDATGRYRHAKRAPVDETTLQPMRRVSKAGLESAIQFSTITPANSSNASSSASSASSSRSSSISSSSRAS